MMNINRQVEVHFLNTGFPFTMTESFMDLFEGLTYAQVDASLLGSLNHQGSPYWSVMQMNPYKYGFYSLAGSLYENYSQTYEINDYAFGLYGGRSALVNSIPLVQANTPEVPSDGGRGADSNTNSGTQECIRVNHSASSPQDLLDLGEAVGSQSRGLSLECISLLPVSKYKCSFFSRKNSQRERCVICQMEYKRGDKQMSLPCKHVYHPGCITRWLSINKACPVCFADVTCN